MLVMGNETSFEGRKKDEYGLLFRMGMENGILGQCSVTGYSIGSKGFFSSL